MAYKDPDVERARDCERFARRIAERRVAGRARDARLRAAGKPRRDPEKARASERRRYRRKLAEHLAQGLCTRCGQAPAAPERAVCENCGEKRREAERTRYAAGRAAGKPYGGRDPDARRRGARARSGKREQARRDAGLCTRCGRRPPVRWPLRPVRAAGLRGRIALRPLRRARSRTRLARTQERRGPPALRRAPGQGHLHRLRRRFARGREVSALRRPFVRTLRSLPRHPGVGPQLHRDRTRHGQGARPVRQRGRCRPLSRVRQAVEGSGGDRGRRAHHGLVHGLGLSGPPRRRE